MDPHEIVRLVPPDVLFPIMYNPALSEKEKAVQLIAYLAEHATSDQVKQTATHIQAMPDAVLDTCIML